MKLQLIIADNCATCARTIGVWQQVSVLYGLEFEVLELGTKNGSELAAQHDLKVFPVLLVNNKIIAVGSPDNAKAEAIIEKVLQYSSGSIPGSMSKKFHDKGG